MPTQDEIHPAPLCNRHDVAVVERIRIGMMCDENAPRRTRCVPAHEICLHPREDGFDPCAQRRIRSNARVDPVHLEKPPRIAVHDGEMHHTVVKGEGFPALHPVKPLHLRHPDKGIVEGTVIVVAVRVEDGHACQQRRNLCEPVVLILVVLIPRPERDIPRMEQKFGLLALCRTLKEFRRMEEMRVRNGHEMKLLRILPQCVKRSLCTALLPRPYFIGICGARLKPR